MIGRYKKCLVVLPKPSCYVYKDNDTKRVISQNINKWVGYLKNLNEELPIVAYAEDALQKLFSVTDNLVYVLGNADTTFVSNNMLEEFPDRYVDECSDDKKIDEKIIKESIDKIKVPDRRKCFDMLEWKTKRGNVVWQRIRYACNEHMKTQNFVLFFTSRGNNFCNSTITESVMGDGKIVVDVDVYTGKADIRYSGVPISESELLTILGGVKDGFKDH